MDMERLRAGWPKLESHMAEAGYSEGYVSQTRRITRRLLCHAPGWECWDDALRWADDSSPGDGMSYMRPHVRIARQFDEEGILPRTPEARRHVRAGARDTLCPGFASVLDAYESSAGAASKKPGTVRGELSNAASFFARLEGLGRTAPSEATEDDVIEVLTGPDGRPAYSPSHVKQVRAVLLGAGDAAGCRRLAGLIPVPRNWRKAKDALTGEEAAAVARALDDPGSALTRRDRAIGCVLLYTGMRPCDVAALRLDSFDRERDAIEIEQQKTGAPLELPLIASVGNAVFDYITCERGASGDPHAFLSTEYPFGGLKAASIRNVACLVLDAAGVRRGGGERGGRAFRRGLATSMLDAGVDRAVAASVLGHADARTTEGYMVASIEGLRRHASLDVSRFPIGKGARS